MKKYLILFSLLYSVVLIGQTKKQVKGEKFQDSGKYFKAIKLYSEILGTDSNNYRALVNRGICYFGVSDYDKSLSDLLKFNKVSPNNPVANAFIGRNYSDKKMWEEGIKYFQLSLKYGYKPDYKFYFDLGSCYYFIGENNEAKIYLNKSYELDSTYAETLNNLGWVNIEDTPQESCKYFKKAYESDSLNFKNVNNLGYSHLLCGDLEIAYNYFNKAELLAPNNSFVYRNYGLYYMYKGDMNLACLNLKKAIDLKIIEEWGVKYISELQNYCSKE